MAVAAKKENREIVFVTCRDHPNGVEDDFLVAPHLEEADYSLRAVSWDEPDFNWAEPRLIVMRSPWDYFQRFGQFLRWLDQLEACNPRVWNPIPLLRSNVHKSYLKRLESEGISIVPTEWCTYHGSVELLSQIHAAAKIHSKESPEGEFVIKPVVSANAALTHRGSLQALTPEKIDEWKIPRGMELMIQPFLNEIQAEGEWSFVFFNGRFSHSILKSPNASDFRVQPVHGGSSRGIRADASMIASAENALKKIGPSTLYARVDMIRRQGRMLLGELELTEPSLFLATHPDSARRFSDAILSRI